MIKKNLGYIISAIIIIISLALVLNKIIENQNIKNNTSSAKTVREETTSNEDSKIYIVKKGDTLWDIAFKNYGDGTKYHEIIKNNPGKTFKFKNGREGLIYPGTELKI